MPTPSIAQLQRAIQISEQIQSLEAELRAILERSASDPSPKRRGRPRKVEASVEAEPSKAKPGRKKKRKLSPEARAKIVAAVKARWAREKA